ncbi:MAG: DMT family transporter [Steroidobacteraceae bacterium]|nr:DMT family transporter [Steroidobacteraceae bacterium]
MRPADFLILVVVAAIWGAAYPLLRVSSPQFGPVALVVVRLAIASIVLLPFVKWTPTSLRHWRKLLVLGLINTAVPFALFAYATLTITGGLASVINATTPMFGALVAYFWLHERLDALRVAGIAIGFCGVLYIVGGEIGTHAEDSLLGVIAAVVGAAMYGVAANYTKRQLGALNARLVAAGNVVAALLLMAPFAWVSWPAVPPSATAWWAVIALGLFCTALAYLLFFRLLSRVSASQAITVTFLIPVFGILWGALFLHEPVTMGLLISAAVVLVGVALATGLVGRRGKDPASIS